MKVKDIYGNNPSHLTANITEYVDWLKEGAGKGAEKEAPLFIPNINITDIQIFHVPNGCRGEGMYSWVAYVKYYD